MTEDVQNRMAVPKVDDLKNLQLIGWKTYEFDLSPEQKKLITYKGERFPKYLKQMFNVRLTLLEVNEPPAEEVGYLEGDRMQVVKA